MRTSIRPILIPWLVLFAASTLTAQPGAATPASTAPISSEMLVQLEGVQKKIDELKLATLRVHFVEGRDGSRCVELGLLAAEHTALAALIEFLEKRLLVRIRHVRIDDDFKAIEAVVLYCPAPRGATLPVAPIVRDVAARVLWRKQLHDGKKVDRFVAKRLILSEEGQLALQGFVTELGALTRLVAGMEKSPLYSRVEPLGIQLRRSGKLEIQETGVSARVRQ